jgi:endonuclease YncB( thermonuclease family)
MVHRPLAHVGERGTPHVAQVVVVLPGGAVQLRSETYGEETVLLSGIQCPDPLDSVFWQAARPFLDRWRGRWMQVKPVQMDASGALVASLTEPNGDRVEVQLVQQGWCRWQRATAPSDKELAQAERTAQQASGPIWRDRLAPR